jgi:hypothetical protein
MYSCDSVFVLLAARISPQAPKLINARILVRNADLPCGISVCDTQTAMLSSSIKFPFSCSKDRRFGEVNDSCMIVFVILYVLNALL